MNQVAIYGAGGFGREVLMMLADINRLRPHWQVLGFFDDNIASGIMIDGYRVLGGCDELNRMEHHIDVIIAVADPAQRRRIVSLIRNPRVGFPSVVHPSVNAAGVAGLKRGSIVTAGVLCTTGIKVGDFCIVNLASTIGHDVQIGDYTTIMPGCHISGNVEVGEEVLVGSGAVVLQNLTIGKQSRVGAGAVVTKPVGPGITVVGVPARRIAHR